MANQTTIQKLLAMDRIAVVGASDDPLRPGNFVPAYLQLHGKTILPVNPKYQQVLGETCYATLGDVPGPVDLVLVFRRPGATPGVVEEAVRIGAAGVWLQDGIVNDEARRLAEEGGLLFVQDDCMMRQMEA